MHHLAANSSFVSICNVQDSLSEDDVMLLDPGKEVSCHYLENAYALLLELCVLSGIHMGRPFSQ